MDSVDYNRKADKIDILAKYQNFVYSVPTMSVTYQPKKVKRLKKHGFLARIATTAGRAVLTARRRKGRAKLTV